MNEAASKKKRRWILATIVSGGLLVLAAALIVPMFINVEAFRPQIERTLTDVTGWDAELGEIDLSLFRGALGVRPARLSAPGGDTSSIEVERIDVKIGLLALLRKELRVKSLRFVRPEMLIVRPDVETGWVRPSLAQPGAPASKDEAPAGSRGNAGETETQPRAPADKKSFTVVIEEIGIRDGKLRLEDRTLTPVLGFDLTDVTSSYYPADGDITGRLVVGAAGGEARWRGRLGNSIEVTLDGIGTETLHAFVGPDLVHAGGRLSGEVTLRFPLRVEGNLTAEGLTLLSGERPFEHAALVFEISPAGLGWELENLEFLADEVRLIGSGPLSPALALVLELPETSLDTAVRAAESVLPLPLDLVPPGRVEATIRVDQRAGEPLSYEASGSLTAAELRPGDMLPPTRDVSARFTLDRAGRFEVQVEKGTMAGGAVRGSAAIESIDPAGTLTFSGGLQDAAFGELLGGFVREVQPVLGSTGFDAVLGVDLTREVLDARSLSGRLDFDAHELSMPGWDLDAAVRGKLEEMASSGAVGFLKELLDRKHGKSEASAGEVADTSEPLIDSLEGTIVFDRWPWGLENVRMTVGEVTSTGAGSFDPERGDVDFTLSSSLSDAESRELLDKYSALKVLADPSGRLTVVVQVKGALVAPTIRVKIDEAVKRNLLGDDGNDDVRGLLKDLLDRKGKKD